MFLHIHKQYMSDEKNWFST